MLWHGTFVPIFTFAFLEQCHSEYSSLWCLWFVQYCSILRVVSCSCLQYLVSAENCICHDISAFTPSNCCHLFPSSLHMAIAVDYITDINQKSTDSFRFTCREGMLEGDYELFIIWLCIDNTSVTMQRKSLDILSTSRFVAIWKIYRENFSTCTDRSKDHFSVLNFLPFVGNFIIEI